MNLLTIEKVKAFQSKEKENCFLPPIKNTFRYISFKMKCPKCSFVAEEAGNSEANAKYHTELAMANHRAKNHENDIFAINYQENSETNSMLASFGKYY